MVKNDLRRGQGKLDMEADAVHAAHHEGCSQGPGEIASALRLSESHFSTMAGEGSDGRLQTSTIPREIKK
jgi:hypothetical protein